MADQTDLYYQLRPEVDVAPLDEETFLFHADTGSVRLEGKSARFFIETVLPMLDGQRSLADICRAARISPEDLQAYLDELVRKGILQRKDQPEGPQTLESRAFAPFTRLYETLGIPEAEAQERLKGARVAILGLEAHGAHLAAFLARAGVGRLLLADPFPFQPEHAGLTPFLGPAAAGRPRQEAVRAALQEAGTEVRVWGGGSLDREAVAGIAAESDLLAGMFDRGFAACNHWINTACLEAGKPAIFAESRAHRGLAGPLVLPGRTACYLCYRMRSIACEDDFASAMSYEESLDRQKQPRLAERAVFPMLPPYLASLVGTEILKHILSIGQPALAGAILEYDAFSLETAVHTILRKPDCPACGVKKNWSRDLPPLAGLSGEAGPRGDLRTGTRQLVSRRTGVVRKFQRIQKDPGEPARPYVYRAEIANHRFLEKDDQPEAVCSGKGMTLEDALVSALGEAVERYSGACWEAGEIVYARRDELPDGLDPRRLVLYQPGQYENLPYSPYADSTRMGWAQARSLVDGRLAHVPALGVFMNYEVRQREEYLCPITSNGLAAGPSLLEAVLHGALEVIERDAFMIGWLNRLPGERIDAWGHPHEDLVGLCRQYQRRGVEIELYRLPADTPAHVCVALGVQDPALEGPAVVAGLGADLDPARAARQAILEVAQVRPALRRRMRQPEVRERMQALAEDPHRVSELEDHDLLYAAPQACAAFDFLRRSPPGELDWSAGTDLTPAGKLERLVEALRRMGQDLLYYNLTPADMGELGVYTARVILPDFQPIDFGWKERRLGGERLYQFPFRQGLREAPAAPETLNDDPHPLS